VSWEAVWFIPHIAIFIAALIIFYKGRAKNLLRILSLALGIFAIIGVIGTIMLLQSQGIETGGPALLMNGVSIFGSLGVALVTLVIKSGSGREL